MSREVENIIDVKYGNVTSVNSKDEVVLLGKYFDKESIFATELKIKIKPEGKEEGAILTSIPYEGYYLQLCLRDFNGDGKEEIMVRGEYGGSGGYAISAIYDLGNNELVEIFNPDMFSEKYKLEGKYLVGNKVLVTSEGTGEEFVFDISNKEQSFLEEIYDGDGKVKNNQEPYVSAVNNAFPINLTNMRNYWLLIRQRVIGVNNSGIIGDIESYVDLLNNNINVVEMGSFMRGKEISNMRECPEKSKCSYPLGTIFTPLNSIEGKEESWCKDFNGDGRKERLIPYTLDGVPYLGMENEEECALDEGFKGDGYRIKEIQVKIIGERELIFVGFELGGGVRKLEILMYKNKKIVKAYGDNSILYSKMCIKDLEVNDNYELIVWLHDSGEKYKVNSYILKGEELKKNY